MYCCFLCLFSNWIVCLWLSSVLTAGDCITFSALRALKTVDELVQKIEFEGPSVSITSKHLALGISALNTTMFNGTSFSAFIAPNSTRPQVRAPNTRASSSSSRVSFAFISGMFNLRQHTTGELNITMKLPQLIPETITFSFQSRNLVFGSCQLQNDMFSAC